MESVIKNLKPYLILALIGFSTLNCFCVYNYKLKQTETRTYSSDAVNQIEVATRNGSIAVAKTTDTVIAALIKKYCQGRDKADAESAIKNIIIKDTIIGNELEIEAEMPTGSRSYGASFEISAPESTELDLNSTNGSITISDIKEKIKVNTTNGKISLSNTSGIANLNTTNGSVNIESHRGSIKANSSNGSFECTLIEFGTSDSINLETTNGSIQIYLPDNISATVDASTTNGSITITGFSSVTYQEQTQTRVRCRIGNGASIINIETTNGNITIRTR
ncbi:MAG: DUF4097 domain-containing protein [candidate division WOR-3 bacterium]|nr:DUF4097 domain-containing protein [candidate division WOR-3 bacterium]MDH5684524.1 DUF4097 domain-containing protein [candidate division WOR-3 bacterium]